jgi:predicted anti-sigma-YlaC factor YlaD
MDCKHSKKLFIFRIKGTLSGQQSDELEQHLNACPSCAGLYNKLNTALDLLKDEKRSLPNPFFYARIEQKLKNISDARPQKYPLFIRILKPAVLSFLIIIAVGVGFIIGATNQNEEGSPVSAGTEISQLANQYQLNMSYEDALEINYTTK